MKLAIRISVPAACLKAEDAFLAHATTARSATSVWPKKICAAARSYMKQIGQEHAIELTDDVGLGDGELAYLLYVTPNEKDELVNLADFEGAIMSKLGLPRLPNNSGAAIPHHEGRDEQNGQPSMVEWDNPAVVGSLASGPRIGNPAVKPEANDARMPTTVGTEVRDAASNPAEIVPNDALALPGGVSSEQESASIEPITLTLSNPKMFGVSELIEHVSAVTLITLRAKNSPVVILPSGDRVREISTRIELAEKFKNATYHRGKLWMLRDFQIE